MKLVFYHHSTLNIYRYSMIINVHVLLLFSLTKKSLSFNIMKNNVLQSHALYIFDDCFLI